MKFRQNKYPYNKYYCQNKFKFNKFITPIKLSQTQMNQALRKRIFPNKCIKLRPPSANPLHQNLCICPMCNQYEYKRQQEILSNQQSMYKTKLQFKLQNQLVSSNCNCDSQSFEWILSRLMLPHHKIINRGIDIYIPQTLFYKDGQPHAIYMNKEIDDYKIKKVKKQKINHTYIQKIMNQRRRKYRDQVQIHIGQKVLQKKQSIFAKKQQKVDTKDASIVQFIDKSQQLITQNQLINLMLKRKQDPIWKKILMIKNFLTSKQISKRLIKLSFEYKSHLYPQLFERTKLLMKIYGGNILAQQKEYIAQTEQKDFCNQLLSRSYEVFAEYSLYKIISYIEYFYDEQILTMQCAILVNQFNRPYIVDVFSLQKKQLVKYNWTGDQYKKKVQAEENRIFMNDKQILMNPQIDHVSKLFQQSMYDKYLIQKDKYGLTMDPQDTTQEQNNDKFFHFLHPEFKQNLSQVLRTQKNISIIDFKKNYLGYIPEKKPIMKPFASNFVKMLHSLTPRVRFSQPKNIISQTLEIGRGPAQTFRVQKSPVSKTFRSRKIQTSLSTKRQQNWKNKNKTSIDFFY